MTGSSTVAVVPAAVRMVPPVTAIQPAITSTPQEAPRRGPEHEPAGRRARAAAGRRPRPAAEVEPLPPHPGVDEPRRNQDPRLLRAVEFSAPSPQSGPFPWSAFWNAWQTRRALAPLLFDDHARPEWKRKVDSDLGALGKLDIREQISVKRSIAFPSGASDAAAVSPTGSGAAVFASFRTLRLPCSKDGTRSAPFRPWRNSD